jgi:S-formylglutathione hydrolase FrmB
VWFATKQPPQLPVVMMINGDLDTPQRWINSGNAVDTADAFAAQHGGNAPILVVVDTAGQEGVDTECVNGVHGAVENHLVQELPQFGISHFHASSDPAKSGIVGWSMGGTCAVDLATMHPERFSGFVDIAGYLRPDAGDRDDTIENLYGGNAAAYDLYDPIQAMNKHGKYAHTEGWFQVSGDPDADRDPEGAQGDLSGVNPNIDPAAAIHLAAAKQLCGVARHVNIDCAVVARMGRHRWPFASAAFAESLLWLAGFIQTPGVPPVLLPVH